MRAAVAASLLAFVLPGTGMQATYASGTLGLALHYEMTCRQPGPATLTIRVPDSWRLSKVRVTGRASSVAGHAITVTIPGPAGVTCHSISIGTLRVQVTGVHAPAGSYAVRAEIRRYAFTAHLRIS